jgi:hypothetical protein
MAAHQEDGVTVADILNETEEQKQAGRIKYSLNWKELRHSNARFFSV